MPIRIVQSKQNARLKELRRALGNPARELGREGRGLAGIEGPNLLKEAVRAGLRIDCVFAAEGTDAMREVLALLPAFTAGKGELDAAWNGQTPWPSMVALAAEIAKRLD